VTHAELVARAVSWLRNRRRCSVVLAECGTWCVREIPDAIGWTYRGASTLVECKATRADFLADKAKPHRSGVGLGSARFYMAPAGVIAPEEAPTDWGLLSVSRNKNGSQRVIVEKTATEPQFVYRPETREMMEVTLLVAELRRLSVSPPPWVKCKRCDKPLRRVGALVGIADAESAGDEPGTMAERLSLSRAGSA
jgi:hypothetical protein